jgi:hypothetical protein
MIRILRDDDHQQQARLSWHLNNTGKFRARFRSALAGWLYSVIRPTGAKSVVIHEWDKSWYGYNREPILQLKLLADLSIGRWDLLYAILQYSSE